MIHDITFWGYFVQLSGYIAASLLFLIWWYRHEAASEVYILITLLMVAATFETTVTLYARYLKNTDIFCYWILLDSHLWAWRNTFRTIIVWVLVFRMAYRWFSANDLFSPLNNFCLPFMSKCKLWISLLITKGKLKILFFINLLISGGKK